MDKTEPAFPLYKPKEDFGYGDVYDAQGTTYRQWLIGQALSGVCANPAITNDSFENVADIAVKQADAVIERLEKENA